MALTELVERRTYTRKTFLRDDGAFVSRCHAGHIHYKDDVTGQLTDVDFSWVDGGAFWVLSGASYRLRVAKDFGATALIEFRNKLEGADHVITYDPRRIVWITNRNFNTTQTIATQQSVQGVITGPTIRWTNAFGPGIHFELTRMRSGFTKEIIIDSFAALGTPPNGVNTHVALIFRYGGTGLTVKDDAGQTWDGSTLFERSGRFQIVDAQNRPTFIAPATVRDASERRTSIPVAFVQRPEGLLQVKILTRAILNGAVYPLRADTTTQFYAGAGDGHVLHTGSSTWSTVHDALTGSSASATGTDARPGCTFNVNFFIGRAFIPIDTSGLPDGDTITAADLKLQYVASWQNDDNDGDDFLVVVGPTSQAANTTLATADYDQCGAISNPQELSNRIDLGVISQSTSAYETFTLNATGLANISKTGFTLLGLREGHDVLNSPIASSIQVNRWFFATSEDTSGTKDPYLEVVHASTVQGRPLVNAGLVSRGLVNAGLVN